MILLSLMIILTMAGQRWINGEIASADALQTPSDYTDTEKSDLKYLQQHVYAIIEGSSSRRSAVRTTPAQNVPIPWQSRWADGFFHDRSNAKKPAARRRVTTRPKDIVANVTRNGTVNNGSGQAITTNPSTSKSITSATRLLFVDEQECVSANGGRACVCFMTDFLDLVGQRLDEAVDGDDDGTVEFRCQSFKAVPVAFNLYPPPVTVVGMTVSATADTRNPGVLVERNGDRSGTRALSRASRARSCGHGTRTSSRASRVLGHRSGDDDKSVTTVSWKEVDFDDVVNYRLEKPKDGKCTQF